MRDLTPIECCQLRDEAWELIENGALIGVDFIVIRFGRGDPHIHYSGNRGLDIPAMLDHAKASVLARNAAKAN